MSYFSDLSENATIGAFVIFENLAGFSSLPSTSRGKFINEAGYKRRLSEYLIGSDVSLMLLPEITMAAAKILIVEDDQILLATLKYKLRKEGYSVVTANDGSQTVEIARRKKPRFQG